MKISYKLLNEFIKLPNGIGINEVAERLTFSGSEVESIEYAGGKLSGAVVAKVKKLSKHSKKESWNIVDLDLGNGKSAVCVTAAKNLKDGDIVPYGAPGTVLADGTVLAEREFDGVISEGMLLSADELGVPDIALDNGILRLNERDDAVFTLGSCAKKDLGLDDAVLDISITPNRGDLLSVIGISRELNGLFPGSELKNPISKLAGIGRSPFPYEFDSISLPDRGCLQYSLGAATDIKIGPSPLHVRVLLTLMGMRPISNMVDVTNLAMLVTGQPLHAFDLDMFKSREITVRSANAGEKIVTLDNKERVLSEQDMLITSGGVAIGIAGVMGGLNSEIRDTTTTVALESASFEAMRVSHTSRRLGIPSEAAHRYARGVDVEAALLAMNYALGLMAEWGAAKCGFVPMIEKNDLPKQHQVTLTKKNLYKILLTDNMSEAQSIIEGFGLKKVDGDSETLTFTVPSWRADISIEEDLIEEVGRFKGYNETEPRLPKNVRFGKIGSETSLAEKLRTVMLARGYAETLTYSFLHPGFVNDLHLENDPRGKLLSLANPISAEMASMRTTLLPGLLKALLNNLLAGWREGLKLFEQGRVFLDTEFDHIAGVIFNGRDSREPWHDSENFFSVKADVMAIGEARNMKFSFERGEEPFGHAGQTAFVLAEGKKIGYILRIKPSIEAEMEFGGAVYAFELDVSCLGGAKPVFKASKAFPAATRDISILVPIDSQHADIISHIRSEGGELLEGVRLFDIYDGKGIPEGQRSLAFSLCYRANDRTLLDEEIEQINMRIRDMLSKKGYTLR